MQEDVYRDDGLNLYVYCENNPVVWIDASGFAKKRNTKNAKGQSNNKTETFVRHFGSDEAADVLKAMRNLQSKNPIEVLRPKVDKFGTVHRSAKWISEEEYQRDRTKLGQDRDYTLIMETEMGTKEWLKDNSTKETKEVQNRDKVIMKDQEIGSYCVGSELLDEFNSRVLSATVVDKNERKIATCKKE